MQFRITYAAIETGEPWRSAMLDAPDLDVAAQRAVANCGDSEFVVRVEQPGMFTDEDEGLELIPEPSFIPLGYSLGSADLPHDRTLELIGGGSNIYFRIRDRRAYVKLNLNGLAYRASLMLTGEGVS